MSHPIRAYPINGKNHITYPHMCSGCLATVIKLKYHKNGKWETWMVYVYILWTQGHNILFTVLFHRKKKKNSLFSFVSMCLWKLLHYLSDETVFIGSCSYFTWMTGKVLHSIAYFSKSNSTLLAGSCAHSPRDTSRGRHTQFPGCQVPASSLIIYETFLTRGERKPAFSIPDFPSKQSLQSLCVWQWLVTCVEDFINSEADFSPAATSRKSKVQRHRPVAGLCFAFLSVGL